MVTDVQAARMCKPLSLTKELVTMEVSPNTDDYWLPKNINVKM
jgi:hypothetical protein